VLLVDDDPVILRLLQVNFRLEDFETATASRGDEVLPVVGSFRPDAIVLDLMLPGIDGHQVFERLRAEPGLSEVPVVFLSARMVEDVGARYEGMGGVTFVAKPFDPSELVAVVREAIDARQR
jgi:DNA-binding response OmpR family regulator